MTIHKTLAQLRKHNMKDFEKLHGEEAARHAQEFLDYSLAKAHKLPQGLFKNIKETIMNLYETLTNLTSKGSEITIVTKAGSSFMGTRDNVIVTIKNGKDENVVFLEKDASEEQVTKQLNALL